MLGFLRAALIVGRKRVGPKSLPEVCTRTLGFAFPPPPSAIPSLFPTLYRHPYIDYIKALAKSRGACRVSTIDEKRGAPWRIAGS